MVAGCDDGVMLASDLAVLSGDGAALCAAEQLTWIYIARKNGILEYILRFTIKLCLSIFYALITWKRHSKLCSTNKSNKKVLHRSAREDLID